MRELGGRLGVTWGGAIGQVWDGIGRAWDGVEWDDSRALSRPRVHC